jgi:8-oxo-dGTP pyrophosphatase MutT (NUDIX family)
MSEATAKLDTAQALATSAPIRCAGVVAIRDIGQGIQIGIIAASAADAAGKKPWVLPKGHVEPGETLEFAALREAAEELGVTGLLIHPGFTYAFTQKVVDYVVQGDGEAAALVEVGEHVEVKEVTLFPLLVTQAVETAEKRTVEWHTVARAVDKLEYPIHIEAVRRARCAV